MRRNLVLFAIMWALVLLLIASCATKNGRVFFGGGWLGPSVTEVAFNPATGPYYSGASVTFSVTATATNTTPGTLTYSWSVDSVGTVTAGAGTNSITVTLGADGSKSGSVTVRETLGDGTFMEASKNFTILIEVVPNFAPVIASLSYAAPTITATYSDADGDDLTVTWATDMGTVTPVASDNTTATATFTQPAGEGTATVTFTVSDGIGEDSDTIEIVFTFDPWEGAAEDSVFLIAPATATAGTPYDVTIYAWPAAAKPLGNLNSVRLLATQSAATANSITRGGFFDGFDGTFFPPLLIQQPTFMDIGINFGGGTTTSTTRGVLAVVTFTSSSAGNAPFDIMGNDGAQDRTFYSDLSGNNYTFNTIGKDYGSGSVTSERVVAVS